MAWRLVFAGAVPVTGLMAALTAVLIAGSGVGGAGAGGSAQGAGPSAGGQALDARQVLLTAAEQSLRTSATSGRYWVSRSERGEVHPVGTGSRYSIINRTRFEVWTALSTADTSWAVVQPLGAAPLRQADEQAWRQQGSPDRWVLTGPDGRPSGRTLTAGPGSPSSTRWNTAFTLAGRNVSPAEVRALPTDPAALKAMLVAEYAKTPAGETPDDPELATSEFLFRDAVTIALELPVSPQVRAAAYRMLADLKGVRSLGTVTDQRGRTGTAVAFTWRLADAESAGGAVSTIEDRLILDPGTGAALELESRFVEPHGSFDWASPGELFHYTLVASAGWTDATPPAAPATN
jgi:hypothetical protein